MQGTPLQKTQQACDDAQATDIQLLGSVTPARDAAFL